jgi:hypothetical protein
MAADQSSDTTKDYQAAAEIVKGTGSWSRVLAKIIGPELGKGAEWYHWFLIADRFSRFDRFDGCRLAADILRQIDRRVIS